MSRRWKRYLRPIAPVILVFFTWFSIHPWNYASAASNTSTSPASRDRRRAALLTTPRIAPSDESVLADILTQIETTLSALHSRLGHHEDARRETAELTQLQHRLHELDTRVHQGFARIEQHLKDKRLPEQILQRHREMVSTYDAELTQLLHNLEAIDTARDVQDRRTKTEQALQHLQSTQHQRPRPSLDPNNLPFRVPDGQVRKPYERKEDFWTSLMQQQLTQVASAVMLPGMLASAQGIELHAPPAPEDLVPTEDVQLTDAIRELAASLDNNPVKIYNWVHNNIEFLPTYGSIQGAEMTLEHKAGNAFDTASLLIALLRAAGIPTRYVLGTVQIPIAKVMNWVGGVNAPGAALQALGQGGIPSTGLVEGGVIKAVKMEHIWVSAWVDFVPSRGAKHRQGDTWVPMDAAFKQYNYTEGMDLQNRVPFDAQSLLEQVIASAEVDETAGWLRGVDDELIKTAALAHLNQVNAFVLSQQPEATVAEVFGTKKIVEATWSVLPSGLPYKTLVRAHVFSEIPNTLRHKYQFMLYASKSAKAFDEPLVSFVQSLPALIGKKITLSFAAASEADVETITNFISTPPDPISFPTELPGYLIRLLPELWVDGNIVATGQAVTMGQTLVSTEGVYDPIRGWQYAESNAPVAGEYRAIAINAAGIATSQVQGLAEKLNAIKAALEAEQLSDVSKDDLLGEMLYSIVLIYFFANDLVDYFESSIAGVVTYRRPSFGSFTAMAQPQYWFGVPRQVSFRSLELDIDHMVNVVVSKENDRDAMSRYVLQSGFRQSAFEHLVPESMLTDADHPGEAVSAVKAIHVASRQGQRISRINQDNISGALSQLRVDIEVQDEIRQAVAMGMTAIVSQHPITLGSWTGVGYIMIDPATGSGAFKISGGANGAASASFGFATGITASLLIAAIAFGSAGAAIFVALPLLILIAATAVNWAINLERGWEWNCFWVGFGLGVTYFSFFTSFLGEVLSLLTKITSRILLFIGAIGTVTAFTKTTPIQDCFSQ